IINGLITSGFFLAIFSIYFFGDQILSGSVGRIGKSIDSDDGVISPLALAYSSVLTISICIYKLLYEKSKLLGKIFTIIVILLSIVLFLLGSTRGALVALFLIILVFIYFGDAKRKMISIVLVVLSAPIVIWAIEFTGSSILERT